VLEYCTVSKSQCKLKKKLLNWGKQTLNLTALANNKAPGSTTIGTRTVVSMLGHKVRAAFSKQLLHY
jgi:hypothetical protein